MLNGDDLFTRAVRGTIAGTAVLASVGLMALGTRPVYAGAHVGELIRARLGVAVTAKGPVDPTGSAPAAPRNTN